MTGNIISLLRSDVLGQLLLMQSVLGGLPDKETIFSFVCQGLRKMPGVAEVRYSPETENLENKEIVQFPIKSGASFYGELQINVSDSSSFNPYIEYLDNFCFMVAVILEERATSQRYEELAEELEQRVKERTEALGESEDKLNVILNYTSDGILVADAEARTFMMGNNTICRMLGYSMEEIVGMGVEDIHPKDDLPEILNQFAKMARREIEVIHYAPVMKKDGTVFYADISATPTKIKQKEYLIGLFRDCTERKEAEERIRQSQKLEAIGTLAGGIAHDFNNILSIIIGYGDLTLERVKPENALYSDVQQVVMAGKRAKDLVNQILTLSRKSSTEKNTLNLQLIVKEAVKMLRSTLPTTIDIQQKIDVNCSPIYADATQMHQVVMNLFTNAFHALEETGGIVKVPLQEVEIDKENSLCRQELKPGRYAQLDIEDSGPGIEKEVFEHIFDPYYTTKPQGKGTGLGLSIVHGIVEGHGGKVCCESEPGSGAIFSVWLPITEEVAEDGETGHESLPTGKERILLVDDEIALTGYLERFLGSLGYKVISLNDSNKAFELFCESPHNFDLIITDQTMPHLPGSELAKEMIQVRPDIPIILCTGFSSIVDEKKAKEIGFKAYFLKPVNKYELAETVRNVLDKSSK